ncbi:hypothetical protein JST56_04090 [Candidatus Dependentiae bacterium]|nr:hypothetical protein [Candidatus Dependentiae bacterium]
MRKFLLFFFAFFLESQTFSIVIPMPQKLDIDEGPVHILEDAQRFLDNPNHKKRFTQLPEWTFKMAIRLIYTSKTEQQLDHLNVKAILQRLQNLTNHHKYGITLDLSNLKAEFPEINQHLYEIFALAEAFTQQHITNLIISNNELTEEFLLASICHLKHLIRIDLSNNKFTELPHFIFTLADLKKIKLNNNNVRKAPHRNGLRYYLNGNEALCGSESPQITRIAIEK